MQKIIVTALLAILTLTGCASISGGAKPSSDWRYIMTTGEYNSTKHYVLPSSVKLDANGVRSGYFMDIHSEPKLLANGKNYTVRVDQLSTTCDDGYFNVLSSYAFDKPILDKEHIVVKFKVDPSDKVSGARENSLGWHKIQYLCSR